MWWAAQATAASAQPAVLKGPSAPLPSRPPSRRVGISGPRPKHAIKPVVPDYSGRVILQATAAALFVRCGARVANKKPQPILGRQAEAPRPCKEDLPH